MMYLARTYGSSPTWHYEKKVLKEVSVIECLYICGCLHARQATACRNKTATHFSHSHNAAQPMVNTVHVEIAITSIVIIEE